MFFFIWHIRTKVKSTSGSYYHDIFELLRIEGFNELTWQEPGSEKKEKVNFAMDYVCLRLTPQISSWETGWGVKMIGTCANGSIGMETEELNCSHVSSCRGCFQALRWDEWLIPAEVTTIWWKGSSALLNSREIEVLDILVEKNTHAHT